MAISCVLREGDDVPRVVAGQASDPEGALIQRFFDGIEKYTPQLVSWNGGGFDLPVLHYRGLVHGVAPNATGTWATANRSRDFKWNNYISRYHTRHCDLMDVLAMYQPRNNAPLDELAKLAGLPGKLGMDGSQVWGAFRDGRIDEIRDYCETDVANTYLLYLRFQLMRGAVSRDVVRRRGRAGARDARRAGRAALARIPRPLAGSLAMPEAVIESLDREGRGVAHVDGKAVFIEGALTGETVEYSSYRRKPSFELATATRVIHAAGDARRTALPAFRRLRRLRAPARRFPTQVAAKQRVLEDSVARTSARSSPRRCCRRSAGPSGATATARACRCGWCTRRAACWSAFTSAARATSPTCAAARCCRATWPR